MQTRFIALVALLAVSAVSAQNEPTDPAPNIVVNEPVFDFGERENSQTVEHTYEILNQGDLDLEIQQTKTSCGCTVASISRKIIPPGESATLTARLNLHNRRGIQRKNITVMSNDPDTPSLQLRLEGTATASLTVNPERIFLSGLKPDSDISRSVDIKSSEKPMKILEVINPLNEVDATIETIREDYEYRLTVTTKPPLNPGRFQNHIRLKTDHPSQADLSVLVMGDVVGALAFAPTQIVLSTQTSTPNTRYVVVRPGSQSTFTITNIELPNDTIEAKTFSMGDNGYRIQLLNIVPNMSLNGQKVIIHTDSEAMPVVEIPFIIQGGMPTS